MSLRSPIPVAIREELSNDPFMARCVLESSLCAGRIEWMHVLTYGGKRQNAKYLIIPGCHYHHYHEARYRMEINAVLRQRIFDLGAVDDFVTKYPRSDLFAPISKRGRTVKV